MYGGEFDEGDALGDGRRFQVASLVGFEVCFDGPLEEVIARC